MTESESTYNGICDRCGDDIPLSKVEHPVGYRYLCDWCIEDWNSLGEET